MVYEILLIGFMSFGVVFGVIKDIFQMSQSFWGTFGSLFAYLLLLHRIGVYSGAKHITRYNHPMRVIARWLLFISLMFETAYGFMTHGQVYNRSLLMNLGLFIFYTVILVYAGGYERIFFWVFKRPVIRR